jgi:hypothetical protein
MGIFYWSKKTIKLYKKFQLQYNIAQQNIYILYLENWEWSFWSKLLRLEVLIHLTKSLKSYIIIRLWLKKK